MDSVLKEKLAVYQKRCEAGIERFLPPADERPGRLHAAMRYSLSAGGKRIRPVLLLAASELFPARADPLAAAVAIECLHTYTLIHDDLPCVDDSDLRRGVASCHRQFDEPTALLAGDALLTHAFHILALQYRGSPELAVALIAELSEASGSQRLIGGQQEDIENEGRAIDPETLRFIHLNKTAALLAAALKMGLRFATDEPQQLQLAGQVGTEFGLAFQIVDDILDATSDAATLGKPVGRDEAARKSTYVALHGIEGARQQARAHTDAALSALDELSQPGGESSFLAGLVRDLETRLH